MSWNFTFRTEIITNLPKLRSLARGWGKTATGGELISFLWAPEEDKIIAIWVTMKKHWLWQSVSLKDIPAMAARVMSSEYPPSLSPDTTPQLSFLKSSECIWRKAKQWECKNFYELMKIKVEEATCHHAPSPQKECLSTSGKAHWTRL